MWQRWTPLRSNQQEILASCRSVELPVMTPVSVCLVATFVVSLFARRRGSEAPEKDKEGQ